MWSTESDRGYQVINLTRIHNIKFQIADGRHHIEKHRFGDYSGADFPNFFEIL